MRRFSSSLIFVFLFGVLFLYGAKDIRADFKLLDSIEEFGEKRFVKSQPTHLKTGPLRIYPFLRSSVQYDDNILLEPRDKRSDIVYNLKPGAILELPIQRHQIAVGYESEFELFTKRRHREQNDVNQNFFALADFRFTDWYLNVLEYFSETSSRAGTTFTSRIPHYDQSVNPKIGYKWKRTTFEAGYRNYNRFFRQHANYAFNFNTQEWTGTVFYDLFARLKAAFDYQFAEINYHVNPIRDAHVHQVRVGLEGEILNNVFMKFRVGPQLRNYRNSAKKDYNSVVTSLQLDYQVRKNLKLKAKFSREPVEATFGNVNFYTEHYGSLGVEYTFMPRWTLFEDTAFFKHHYAERGTAGNQFGFRRDTHVSVKAGLRYQFREWWQWEASYEYWHRNSNFSDFDFDDNRFTLSSNLAY